jgi:hypothetical protein
VVQAIKSLPQVGQAVAVNPLNVAVLARRFGPAAAGMVEG